MEKLTDRLSKSIDRVCLCFTLVPIGAALLLTLLCKNLIYNAAFGPFPVDVNYLSSIESAWSADKYYVSIQGAAIEPTPYIIASVRSGEQPNEQSATHQVAILVIPPKIMLVKVPKNQSATKNVTGTICRMEKDLPELFKQDMKDSPDVVESMLPVMLDAGSNIGGDMALYEVVFFLLMGTGAVHGIRFLLWRNPENHPVGKALKKFGTLREMTNLVNSEGLTAQKYGPATLTDTFLFFPKLKELVAVKLTDIVWAYLSVSENEVKKPSNLTIWTRDGKKAELLISQTDRESLLKTLTERLPHIITGFDAKRWLTWRSKPQSLVDEVDARRTGQAS